MKAMRQLVSILQGFLLTLGAVPTSSAVRGASLPAKAAIMLGVVTHSDGGHIGEADLSEGTTIYDGDCLSTEEDGRLAVHTNTANLQLEAESSITLHRAKGDGVAAELAFGTLVFSAARVSGMEVDADGAVVRPAADVPTVAHVRIVDPKELRIYARRGDIELSYGEQTAVILEGEAYRVALDPPSAAETDGTVGTAGAPTRTAARRRSFLLIAITAAAVAAVAATHVPENKKHHESPFTP